MLRCRCFTPSHKLFFVDWGVFWLSVRLLSFAASGCPSSCWTSQDWPKKSVFSRTFCLARIWASLCRMPSLATSSTSSSTSWTPTTASSGTTLPGCSSRKTSTFFLPARSCLVAILPPGLSSLRPRRSSTGVIFFCCGLVTFCRWFWFSLAMHRHVSSLRKRTFLYMVIWLFLCWCDWSPIPCEWNLQKCLTCQVFAPCSLTSISCFLSFFAWSSAAFGTSPSAFAGLHGLLLLRVLQPLRAGSDLQEYKGLGTFVLLPWFISFTPHIQVLHDLVLWLTQARGRLLHVCCWRGFFLTTTASGLGLRFGSFLQGSGLNSLSTLVAMPPSTWGSSRFFC